MSWSLPTQGQWGHGAAMMTPDMMNAGSYTPEQWAVAQQNWQQWQQWQQQYAQWQTQYGEKYAQQMQAMQAAGAAPPAPPPSAPPPAPPPPDQPPPPLPYENNQPLYGKPAPPQPTPVPAPTANRASNPTNVNVIAGNAQNQWSYDAKDAPPPTQTVNTDALKKLAEEEKLFDIQFQKWEEEIDKWRKENVNHPDKAAYKEYEQKFEACRAQLLERRQQMQLKRARLTSNAPNAATASGNTSAVPPPINTSNNTYNQSQGYNNRQDYQSQPQGYGKKPDQNYPNTNAPYKQFNNPPNSDNYNNRGNRGAIDPQDGYDSYGDADNYAAKDDYPSNKSSFLPTSGASKSIPGLDLVPDTDKSQEVAPPEVIDITGDQALPQKGPDYSTISKGISHILGDEKIMNILSSLQGHSAPEGNTAQNAQPFHQNNLNVPPPSLPNQQWNRNNNYNNQQFGNKNMPFTNRPNQNPMQQNQDPGYQENRFNPSQDRYGNMEENSEQDMYYNRNNQYGGPNNMPQRNNQGPNFPQRNDQGPNFPPRTNQGSNFSQGPNFPPRNDNGPNLPPRNDIGPNFRPRNDSGSNFQGQDPNFPPRYNQAQGPNLQPRNEQAPNQGPGYNAPPSLLDLPMQSGGNFQKGPPSLLQNPPAQPPKPKWVEEPLFTASIIVEYEHKPLRVKGRTFLEPVHTFDYDHKSKESENRKKDFEREADEMFSRLPRREKENAYMSGRFEHSERHIQRDPYNRDFERRIPREPREEARDDYRNRPIRDDFEERRRPDDRFFDRRREDRDRYPRREDSFRDREREREKDREKDRDYHRERYNRDSHRRDDANHRSRSRDKESRKRELSKESETASKKSRDNNPDVADKPKHVVMIDDILESPGREMRPEKIVIILRGPPGSGKSYLAKLIRDREAEYGGTARIMSIDDYFMQEGEIEEKDPTTGKVIKKPTLKYEYDEKQEETYLNSLKRAFKRSLTDGYFTFLIYDAVNDHLRSYADIWNFARQNGFQAYVCTTDTDPQACFKRNIHNRTLEDIQVICSRFFPTPAHHIQLDASTLLQSAAITEVTMEDADDEVVMEDAQEPEVESVFTSKWEKMDDAAQLAKLDGTNKPLRPSQLSMADYLQLDDWTPNKAKPGKKTVRWADIEESRQQEKMRAIGFVVGQTDWNRMTDPTMGSSALTQTKYIERVRRT